MGKPVGLTGEYHNLGLPCCCTDHRPQTAQTLWIRMPERIVEQQRPSIITQQHGSREAASESELLLGPTAELAELQRYSVHGSTDNGQIFGELDLDILSECQSGKLFYPLPKRCTVLLVRLLSRP